MRDYGIYGRLLIALSFLSSGVLHGQGIESKSFPVFHEGKALENPFAGGLNEPQFSPIHLDGDTLIDLIIFDRSGQILLPFLQIDSSYKFAPRFQEAFPPIQNFLLVRDFNQDGLGDLFTHESEKEGMKVYENISSPSSLEFVLENPLLSTSEGIPLFIPSTDLPGIVDVDHDGDLDILAFDAVGSYVNLFENLSSPTLAPQINSLVLADPCWGLFREDGLSNDVFLNDPCSGSLVNPRNALHAGSTLTPIPQEGGELVDLVLGDITHENLVYLKNSGTVENSVISDFSPDFPSNSTPVNLPFFPAAFLLDANFDQVLDLVVAPNASGISDNYQNVWLYEGSPEVDGAFFSLLQKDFLQDEMIDCGANSHPASFDYNGDGLPDLLIGNKAYQSAGEIPSASFTLYENIGSKSSPSFSLMNRNYLNLGSFFSQIIQEVRPAFGDIDSDGDMDLIIGDINGQLHVFANSPQSGLANFDLQHFRFEGIDVGQNASPQLIDINGDNLLDLLVGEGNGTLNYFQNMGSRTNPSFGSEPTQENWGGIDISPACCTGFSVPFAFRNPSGTLQVIVGSESGEMYLFQENVSDPTAPFIRNENFPSNWGVGSRTSPWQADLDGDGAFEWIIGNSRGGIGVFEAPFSPTVSRKDGLSENPILIFPNPSSSPNIHVHFPKDNFSSFSYQVFDINGRLFSYGQVHKVSKDYRLGIPDISPGIYLVKIHVNGKEVLHEKWLYLPK